MRAATVTHMTLLVPSPLSQVVARRLAISALEMVRPGWNMPRVVLATVECATPTVEALLSGGAADRLIESGTPADHGAGCPAAGGRRSAGDGVGVAAGAGAQVAFVTSFGVPSALLWSRLGH